TGGGVQSPFEGVNTVELTPAELAKAEAVAADIAILEMLASSNLWGTEQHTVSAERVEVIDQTLSPDGQDKNIISLDATEKLAEILEPLAEQFGLQIGDGKHSIDLLQESSMMNAIGERIDNWFTAPNGEIFSVSSITDAEGNVSQHFINANGDIVGQDMIAEISNYLKNFQEGESGKLTVEGQILGMGSELAQDPNFSNGGELDFIKSFGFMADGLDSSASTNDPSSSSNGLLAFDPNDPMQPFNADPNAVNILDSLLVDGANTFNLDNLTNSDDGAKSIAKLEEEILASIDPMQSSWLDPIIDANPHASHDHDADHKHHDWLHEQKEKERDEHDRREREEREREAKHRAEEKAKDYAAAMMAALKEASKRSEAERQLAQEQLLQKELRRKYVVLPGDTLESIAQKMFYNKGLASLIYEINRALIPVVVKEGKRLLQLKPRTVIFLPAGPEIKRFNSRLFGKNPVFEYDTATNENADNSNNTGNSNEKPNNGLGILSVFDIGARKETRSESEKVVNIADRRKNIESILGKLGDAASAATQPDDGRIVYNCRLGDTLRSIALRHPALKDVSLWKLIAEINDLSLAVDSKGHPIANLTRNTKLKLPLVHEIMEFKNRKKASSTSSQQVQQAPQAQQAIEPTQNSEQDSEDMIVPDGDQVPELDNIMRALRMPEKVEDPNKQITILAERCRLTRSGEQRGGAVPYTLALEIFSNNSWLPIITYEVTAEES
ncbi:MAG: LysM peptidoglycan-binding domain-containing protein, partial [Candidatus Obscuribacterales bacterium]|nr:LysM peptidoglycan-binding domain-containing protein [Candidatus Obscuribacterales bacterium]